MVDAWATLYPKKSQELKWVSFGNVCSPKPAQIIKKSYIENPHFTDVFYSLNLFYDNVSLQRAIKGVEDISKYIG